jgi:hypothetical protein
MSITTDGRGLSIKELCFELRIDRTTVWRRRRKQRPLAVRMGDKLVEYFWCPAARVFYPGAGVV